MQQKARVDWSKNLEENAVCNKMATDISDWLCT